MEFSAVWQQKKMLHFAPVANKSHSPASFWSAADNDRWKWILKDVLSLSTQRSVIVVLG